MKKAAIMTFHRALNYGAKYQAYALMKTVSSYCDGYILDYRCDAIEQAFYKNRNIKRKLKEGMKWLLFPQYKMELLSRKRKFLEFDKYYKCSEPFDTGNVGKADEKYDIFFAGSDQIWNPIITGKDVNYFLPFCKPKKRNSYAASLGKGRLEDFDADVLRVLHDFNTVSVREKSMIDLLKSCDATLNPIPVCDPVFLLRAEEWKSTFELTEKKAEPYIFIYVVAPQTNAVEKAKQIAAKNGWKIKYIDMGRKKQSDIEAINDAGPIDFLNLLLNAELVITTSFHAFALSMIFHKPVQFELSKEKVNANARLVDLAASTNMSKYEITKVDDRVYSDYDWEYVDSAIHSMSQKSKEYIKSVIAALA